MTKGPFLCAVVASCVAFPSISQAEAPDIVVTGSALPAAKGDAAYDIVTIDRDRLEGTASNRIEDALRDVAGLQQFRRSDARSANATRRPSKSTWPPCVPTQCRAPTTCWRR